MRADGGVAGRDGLRRGVMRDGTLGEIDFTQERGVGSGQRIERASDALAGGVLQKGIGHGFGFELARPAIERRAFCGAAAVVIDEGVAQDAVEPGHGGLTLAQSAGGFERTDVSRLQNVFGERAIAQAALEKAEELPAEIEQRGWDRFGHARGIGAGGWLLLPPGWLS